MAFYSLSIHSISLQAWPLTTMDSDSPKPKKKGNCLSIRLTESAVFLPIDGTPNRRGSTVRPDRNAMLRGLLVLDLVKPTKIRSIDVELSAITSTAWPEGESYIILFAL